jgi:hypothetical protein
MFVTYPFSPASFLARARAFSSRAQVPSAVLTNRGVRADFAPLMTSRARFSCAVRVLLSRSPGGGAGGAEVVWVGRSPTTAAAGG